MAKIKSKSNVEGRIKMQAKSLKKKKLTGSKISKSGKSMMQMAGKGEETQSLLIKKNHQAPAKKSQKAPHKKNIDSMRVTTADAHSALLKLEREEKSVKKQAAKILPSKGQAKYLNSEVKDKKNSVTAFKVKKTNIKEEKADDKVTKDEVIKILLQLEEEDKKKEMLKKKQCQSKESIKNGSHKKTDAVKKSKMNNKKALGDGTKTVAPKTAKKVKSSFNETSSLIKQNLERNKKSNGKTSIKNIKKTGPTEDKVGDKAVATKRKHPKSKGKNNKQNSEQIPKKKVKLNQNNVSYEPVDFDEDNFNTIVNLDNIIKVVEGLKSLVGIEVAKKKTQIFADYKYTLQMTCFQIPCAPKRMVKLKLQHSIVGEGDDVLLIVKDLQRGSKVDHAPTSQYFEDLLRKHNIKGLTVMPFNQFKQEYKPHEMRRKLANSYDYFLCDARVVRHASSICGTVFQKLRRVLHAVRLLNEANIKSNIDKALKCTSYNNFSKGNTISIVVGTDKFTPKQVSENVLKVLEYLKEQYPGSLPNVRNLMLKINITGTTALPIYISTAKGPDETPYVVGPKEQRMNELKKSANEILSKFHMTKEGKITKLSNEVIENRKKIKEAKEALTLKPENDKIEFNKNQNAKILTQNADSRSQRKEKIDGKEKQNDCEESEHDSSGLIYESCEEVENFNGENDSTADEEKILSGDEEEISEEGDEEELSEEGEEEEVSEEGEEEEMSDESDEEEMSEESESDNEDVVSEDEESD